MARKDSNKDSKKGNRRVKLKGKAKIIKKGKVVKKRNIRIKKLIRELLSHIYSCYTNTIY